MNVSHILRIYCIVALAQKKSEAKSCLDILSAKEAIFFDLCG